MKKHNNIFVSIIAIAMLFSCNVYAMKKIKKNVKLKIIKKFSPVLKLSYEGNTFADKKVLEICYLNTLRMHLSEKFAFKYTSKNLNVLDDKGNAEQLVYEIARIGYNRCNEIKENLGFLNCILSYFSPKNVDLVDMFDYQEKERKRIPRGMVDKFLELVLKYNID